MFFLSAWLAKNVVPWRAIGIGLASLFIVAIVAGWYFYVRGLVDDLATANANLAQERSLKEEAVARASDIAIQHSSQVLRIEALEQQRTAIAGEVLLLRETIDSMSIEKEIAGEDVDAANRAVAALNARNAELNRLLEHASGRTAPGGR